MYSIKQGYLEYIEGQSVYRIYSEIYMDQPANTNELMKSIDYYMKSLQQIDLIWPNRNQI